MSAIDWNHLNSLRDDIGAEDFADVVLLFFAEIGEKLDEMRNSEDQPTPDDFHFLRGSAANLGFVDLVNACQRAESACLNGTQPDLTAIMRTYEDALNRTRAEVPELAAV
jgi:HPt (histidine-containing phosphotransfer) domain-containing protein